MERMEIESFEGRPAPMTRGFAFLMGCRPTSVLAKPLLRRQGTAWETEPLSKRGCCWMLTFVELGDSRRSLAQLLAIASGAALTANCLRLCCEAQP